MRSLDPVPLLRFEGRPAPILGTVWELERFRCNLCGEVFVARPPDEVGLEKYDETVPAAVALLKYGSGVPFHRQAVLQAMAGVPLAAAVQWMLVEGAAELLRPEYDELQRQAAQGEVLHNDDTTMKVARVGQAQGRQAHGRVYDRYRVAEQRTYDSPVRHRTQARWGEPGRPPPAASERTAPAHPDVRRLLAQRSN
ncbi:MAG: transposase [Candidatus Eremiobacterota bacterium]